MIRATRFRVGGWIALIMIAGVASAQDAAPQGPLAAMQAKLSLTDDDRNQLRAWISEKLDTITAGSSAMGAAVASLRDEVKGTAAFRDAYVAVCVELFTPVIKSTKSTAATQMAALLAGTGELGATRALLDALGDARPAIRAAAAAGLRNLRAKIAAPPAELLSATIDALKEAGKKEASAGTLRTIYQALDFVEAGVTPSDARPLVSGTLELLDARAELHVAKRAAGAQVPAEGADVAGLMAAGRLARWFTDADRDRLMTTCAKMMRYGVHRYIGSLHAVADKHATPPTLIEQRNAIEILVEECERRLLDGMKPTAPPGLTKFMREGDKADDVRVEFGKWSKLFQEKLNLTLSLDDAP